MDRRILILGAMMAVLVGCKGADDVPFEQWVRLDAPAEDSSGTAYAAYAEAAKSVQRAGERYLGKVKYTPGERASISRVTKPALDLIIAGSKRETVGFRYVPGEPSGPSIYYPGWRLASQALLWRIEDNVDSGQWQAVVRDTVAATRFGLDLGHGSTMEASMGLTLADDARRTMIQSLGRLSAGELRELSNGIERALLKRPDSKLTLDNELKAMLAGVQHVQDRYQEGKLESLTETISPDVDRAVSYLKSLKAKGPQARKTYFEGFAGEAETMAAYWSKIADLPAKERTEIKAPKLTGDRPWKRFSRHYFTAGEPYLAQHDATIARTRLLALEAGLTASVRRQGFAPQDLRDFGRIGKDPYTGSNFAYRRNGKEFRIYSFGLDARDDGGETDESFSTPDVTLER